MSWPCWRDGEPCECKGAVERAQCTRVVPETRTSVDVAVEDAELVFAVDAEGTIRIVKGRSASSRIASTSAHVVELQELVERIVNVRFRAQGSDVRAVDGTFVRLEDGEPDVDGPATDRERTFDDVARDATAPVGGGPYTPPDHEDGLSICRWRPTKGLSMSNEELARHAQDALRALCDRLDVRMDDLGTFIAEHAYVPAEAEALEAERECCPIPGHQHKHFVDEAESEEPIIEQEREAIIVVCTMEDFLGGQR